MAARHPAAAARVVVTKTSDTCPGGAGSAPAPRKPEPAEPEEDDADGGHWHAVTEDRSDLSCRRVFAQTRSQKEDGCQGGESAECVDDGRAGEIVKAHLVEPAAAPFPGTGDRVEKGDQDGGVDHEAVELDPFGHGAGDDGGGGGGEHRLEDEIGPVGVVGVGRSHHGHVVEGRRGQRSTNGQKAVEIPGIHGVEPGQGVGDQACRNNKKVFEEDVDGVLLAGETGLQRGESEMHDKDQSGGDQDPQVVDHEFGIGDGGAVESLHRFDLLANNLCRSAEDQDEQGPDGEVAPQFRHCLLSV